MMSIGKQIIEARKAKGMTQGEIAEALFVSRSTVAHWETGRSIPNGQMLLALSKLLEYDFKGDFEAQLEAADAPQAEDSAAVEDFADGSRPELPAEGGQESPLKPRAGRNRRRWLAIVAVLALCACAVAVFLLTRRPSVDVPAPADEVDAQSVTIDYFRQDNPNVAGKPYLQIESTLRTNKNDGLDMWMYTIDAHEKNGFAFVFDRLEVYTFANDSFHPVTLTRETIEANGLQTTIQPNGDWSFDGGLPIQDSVKGIGFVFRGADEAGEPAAYVFWLPLTAS